ncbi:phage baseplate assembly protein V [Chromobacterium violaceum]
MNAWQKMRLMVARGIVNLVNDAGGLQLLQISALDGETRDEVERAQNFGATSHPPAGSVPVMVAVGGSRDHLVAVAVDNEEHRPKGLKAGESATYNAAGVLFLFDDQGNATLTCRRFIVNASEGIALTTPQGALAGDFNHSGGALTSNGVAVDGHVHGGVERGGAQTDGPR